MSHRCAVVGCANDRRHPEKWIIKKHVTDHMGDGSLVFHSCPLKHFKKWEKIINRKNYAVTKNTRICSNHFVYGQPRKQAPHPSLHLRGKSVARRRRLVKKASSVSDPSSQTVTTVNVGKAIEQASPREPLSKPYYESTYLMMKDELISILDAISSAMGTEDDVEKLRDLLRLTIQLLRGVKEQLETVVELRSLDQFGLRRFEGSDEDIRFWTGFYSYEALMAFYDNFIEASEDKLRYWASVNAQRTDDTRAKCGKKHSTLPIDEMFMTLVKLRQGSANKDLADRFGVSPPHVTRIVVTWINFMHSVLSDINIWMSKSKVRKYMPKCFQGLYKDVRVIIDCTEIHMERPSDFEVQAATYSVYKHCNTLKALIGISPSGVPIFISDLFEGSISDNDITLQSGLLNQCEREDAIMADRGFTMKEAVARRGLRLVVPHFLLDKQQMEVNKLVESVALARVRIHVERCMGRIKQWNFLSNRVPITYWKQINHIFQVCTRLVLFWPPLIDSDN